VWAKLAKAFYAVERSFTILVRCLSTPAVAGTGYRRRVLEREEFWTAQLGARIDRVREKKSYQCKLYILM
jgi:hypothetical protein